MKKQKVRTSKMNEEIKTEIEEIELTQDEGVAIMEIEEIEFSQELYERNIKDHDYSQKVTDMRAPEEKEGDK